MTDIKVEVRPRAGSGDLAPRNIVPEAFSNRIEELGDSLRDIAVRLSRRLNESQEHSQEAWQLGEVELTFSLDLEAEAGVVIARTRATAGFEATLTWKRTGED